ncbi:C-C motif chemokine 3-like [Pelodiscus sinensis]|uniref:C-C motif chemokine n=1 Tax=Pelodiscus sinensis TaxID=13735 RepID=K7FCM7_PELSI|nr:C-C motif chemokine 3-like [Pelodiscus sinensis]|eukprot:XP_006115927.1 C-C motif chemokine 3-like [Pelodiscus sinensis]
MKVSMAALVLLLSTTCGSQVSIDPRSFAKSSGIPTDCCFSYIRRRIPRSLLVGYFLTGGMCSQPGVVFTTRQGRLICANPSDAWVREYVTSLS